MSKEINFLKVSDFMLILIGKLTGKLIKWIICFSPILLKVFFDQNVIISSLSNENLLTLEITIVRDDSKYGVAEISLHESGEFPQETYQWIKCVEAN